MMRILGIDPGLTRCGVALVEVGIDKKIKLLTMEVITTNKVAELPIRLKIVFDRITTIINLFQPQSVAIEQVFLQLNVSTAINTAQAGGVAALAAANNSIPVTYYTPTAVKLALTGTGKANKTQINLMVTKILQLTQAPKIADAADAAALAICHAWNSPLQQKINASYKNLVKKTGGDLFKVKI